jgi:hypothetical protein
LGVGLRINYNEVDTVLAGMHCFLFLLNRSENVEFLREIMETYITKMLPFNQLSVKIVIVRLVMKASGSFVKTTGFDLNLCVLDKT